MSTRNPDIASQVELAARAVIEAEAERNEDSRLSSTPGARPRMTPRYAIDSYVRGKDEFEPLTLDLSAGQFTDRLKRAVATGLIQSDLSQGSLEFCSNSRKAAVDSWRADWQTSRDAIDARIEAVGTNTGFGVSLLRHFSSGVVEVSMSLGDLELLANRVEVLGDRVEKLAAR